MARKPRRQRSCRVGSEGARRPWESRRRQTTRPMRARSLCGAERVSTPETLLIWVLTKHLEWPSHGLWKRKFGGAPSGGGGGHLVPQDSSRQRSSHLPSPSWSGAGTAPNWSAEPASPQASCWPARQPRKCALPDLNHGSVRSLLKRGPAGLGWCCGLSGFTHH